MNKLAGGFGLLGARKKNVAGDVKDEYQLLTVRQLMIRKFLRNRMALLSFIALVIIYLVTLFAGFFAPYTARDADSKLTYSPPMTIRLQDPETGNFHLPFFYPLRGKRNMETFQLEYVEERERRIPIQFFVKGEPYKALGVIAWDVRLFGSSAPEERLHIMGSDVRGRDLFSRIIYGGQVSLSVGIFGVLITIAVGSVIGTLSGYYGRRI